MILGPRALLLLGVAGCPHRSGPVSYDTTPRLPSPQAGSYARVIAEAPDPSVAHIMGDTPWQASLGGAAAGLALERSREGDCELTEWRVQEALWRAGYAHPVQEARCWESDPGGAPPEVVATWVQATRPEQDVALVRARGTRIDAWVGLRARPRIALGLIPRAMQPGDALIPPVRAGARLTAADPDGYLAESPLDEPISLELDSIGEWMIELREGEALLARFPIYVGMAVPETPLFDDPAADELEELAYWLRELRLSYGIPAWQRDPLYDAAARALLEGRSSPEATLASVQAGPTGAALSCDAPTIPDCLADLSWDPHARLGLFASDNGAVGWAHRPGGHGVQIALVLGRE